MPIETSFVGSVIRFFQDGSYERVGELEAHTSYSKRIRAVLVSLNAGFSEDAHYGFARFQVCVLQSTFVAQPRSLRLLPKTVIFPLYVTLFLGSVILPT